MEKFKVSFEANNQQLKSIGTKHASDTYADIEATFVLGEKWTDMDTVSAVWWNDFVRVATVLDSQSKCIVPHEVLTRKGCVRVNLVGSIVEGDELITRLTSYSAEAVQVNEKIKLTGSETSEITPSQFEQFVAVVISEVEKVTGMTAQAETLPAGSQATARYENGILYLGIPQGIQGERGETGQDGADGNGIASVVYNADYTLTLVFDNGETFTTPPIRGERGERGEAGQDGADGRDGADGATPNLTIGTVETLEPTEDATASITGTAENPVLNLGLPKGEKGDTGDVSQEQLDAAVSDLKSDLRAVQVATGDYCFIGDGFGNMTSSGLATDRYSYVGIPTTVTGKLKTVTVKAAVAGAGKLLIAVPFGTSYYHRIATIDVTCAVGVNTFYNGIDFNSDTIVPVGSIIGFYSQEATLYYSSSATSSLVAANEYFANTELASYGGIALQAEIYVQNKDSINDLSNLIAGYDKETVSSSSSSGVVVQYHDGSISVISGFGTKEIPVKADEKYYVSAYMAGNIGVAFLNGSTYVSGLSSSDLGTNYPSDKLITVPSGANLMAVSTRDTANYPVTIKKRIAIYMDAEDTADTIELLKSKTDRKADSAAVYGSQISGTKNSGAFNYTTGAILSSTNFEYLELSSGFVAGNDIAIVGYQMDNANYPICFFVDSDGIRFGAITKTTGGYYKEIVNIPYNAVSIVINGTSPTNPNFQYQPKCYSVSYDNDSFYKDSWMDENYIHEKLLDYSFRTPDHPVVVFVFDDTLSDVSEVIDLFETYNCPINLATIPSNLMANICTSGEVALEAVKRAVSNGGEVLCHSTQYIDASSTLADYERYFVGLKKELVEKYGFEVKGIVRAGGYSTEPDADICLRYLSSYYEYGTGFTSIRANSRYGILLRNSLTDSISTIKSKIDAISGGGLLCYYGHGSSELGEDWITKLTEVLDYIGAIDGAEIATYGDVFRNYLKAGFTN